ncbi:pannexin-2 isoform X3 [Scyliorhinus canicula]|uniref:pannexin-2 isoform X3 n=1 Tax=Scyliorhinus canicula TaxID=7830 RepID=UPI0018F4ECD1|nr:pannexin-2 isoform X3 [Scyliorhinus canicula]
MHNIIDHQPDMATALLAGEKLKELILPGQQDEKENRMTKPFSEKWPFKATLANALIKWEESIYCYTPNNFTRDQALYARGYCWTELRDAVPGVEPSQRPSLFEHKFLPYALLAFAGIMYIPALGWEFLASTRLTSELNFLLQEIDNCYHRAAEGRAPKIEKQIQSKGAGITEKEKREIIENAEKEKSPEQNLFEKYLERRGQSNFLARLYLSRQLSVVFLSIIPITYLCTYYANQKQNEFTCPLGEPPDMSSSEMLHVHVNCKLPSVQMQRIIAIVDIMLLCFINLIILINLIHLFIVRKSNFIFDKLHKVGIKTRKQWQKSQFCDINILALFCNENRDHIKSLNRLDFITNESDLMYDNVVRQLLAALAQSNHDVTPTMRDAGIQTIDPSVDPADIEANEQLIIKRPRKKMKWIPTTNPLHQPFKEPSATLKFENNKGEKPKLARRKIVTDSLAAPLLDPTSKYFQDSSSNKVEGNITVNSDKKHSRHLSLDVHPYIVNTKNTNPVNPESCSSKSQGRDLLHSEENMLTHVPSPIKDSNLSEGGATSNIKYSSESCLTLPISKAYATNCTKNLPPAAVPSNLEKDVCETKSHFNRNPTYPLINIQNIPALYEDREDEVFPSSLLNAKVTTSADAEDLPTHSPEKILLATFEDPIVMVSTIEY